MQQNQDNQNLVVVNENLPPRLPVLPLRSKPIFPGLYSPIIISEGKHTEVVKDSINNYNSFIGLNLLRDEHFDFNNKIQSDDLYRIGVVAKIYKKVNLPDGGMNILINSVRRYKILRLSSTDPIIRVEPLYIPDRRHHPEDEQDLEIKAYTRTLLTEVKALSEDNPLFTEEMRLTMVNVDEPGRLADFVCSMINADRSEQQDVLETYDERERLQKVITLVDKEKEIVRLQTKIQQSINEKVQKKQREFMLREQLKEIKKELGMEVDEKSKELKRFTDEIEKLNLEGEVKESVDKELEKFSLMDTHSPDFTITRNYLETIVSLPWNTESKEKLDVKNARKILDKDHYGLDDVKERVVEFLAVRKLNPDNKGSIICLAGPPGVGKTSMGKSIARATNREFYRFSLGGMRDESEIKGHRRTYIGAMPGKILSALKIVKTKNPVIMLDEIDKLGVSFQGDPSSALLEVLDPEQNNSFRDHYLDLPFDLSNVLFITTANTLDTIPRPLLNRMEVIRLSGYIMEDKLKIAKKYIIPRQINRHGLLKKHISITQKGMKKIIDGYAREAGLRNFERNIERICRKTAAKLAELEESFEPLKIDETNVEELLGKPSHIGDLTHKVRTPGIAIGLAWTALGGSTLTIESIATPIKKQVGSMHLTGQLGDVMKESANIAYSYIRSIAPDYGVDKEFFESNGVHLHLPAGATPKDGPSAGITMATAVLSLARGKKIKTNVAMTGELSLSGEVLPIGGLKEKVIAAKRTGFIKQIICPKTNEKDLEEIPEYIKKGLTFHMVESMKEVIDIVF